MKAYELLELTRIIARRHRKWKITSQEEDREVIHLAYAALETVTESHPELLPDIIRELMKEHQ